MGIQLPLWKGSQPPSHFSAHGCSGQTVAHVSYSWALVSFVSYYLILFLSMYSLVHYPHFHGTEWPIMCSCAIKKLLTRAPCVVLALRYTWLTSLFESLYKVCTEFYLAISGKCVIVTGNIVTMEIVRHFWIFELYSVITQFDTSRHAGTTWQSAIQRHFHITWQTAALTFCLASPVWS